MASIECGRGHLYDPSIYSVCPYCNSGQQAVHFGGAPVGAGNKTMPLSAQQSQGPADMAVNSGKTMPPPNYQGEMPIAASSGVTMPPKEYAQGKKVTEANVTIGAMKEKLGIDPVVGWLVCVEGTQKGKDYKLRGQINTIGRSDKMDVCIKGDNTISSENHARLSYSEKNNRFTFFPADSKNIIYLNGEDVYTPVSLNPFDLIDFGETKLVFIPLCCGRFNWDSGITGGDDNGTV